MRQTKTGRSAGEVTVIGTGNWGSSLAAALKGVPGCLSARIHAHPDRRGKHPQLHSPILWLCVPDREIAATADWIVSLRADLRGQIVVHSSGALNRAVLRVAEHAGARTASVHPMMSFPTRRIVSLANVPFGVESGDTATQKALFQLLRRMGGRPFTVAGEGKAMYHAGAMFGSPLLVAALDAGVRCMRQAGISEQEALALLGPMAAATIANARRRGLAQSFSGPLARGDAATVKVHRQALADHPLLARVYDALARLAIKDLPTADRGETQSTLEAAVGQTPNGSKI